MNNTEISDQPMINNSEMENPAKELADLKKLTLENQKLMQETRTLTWRNQTSFETLESNAELYVRARKLKKLQAENQKLTEEVLRLMKKNNTLLAIQSELYKKAIEVTMSKNAILPSQSTDNNVEFGDEDTWTGTNR